MTTRLPNEYLDSQYPDGNPRRREAAKNSWKNPAYIAKQKGARASFEKIRVEEQIRAAAEKARASKGESK